MITILFLIQLNQSNKSETLNVNK